MSICNTYYQRINEILSEIRSNEVLEIERVAKLLAGAIEDDQIIFVATGGAHGGMGLEELFYRAGGLACINPMLDGGVNLTHGAIHATKMERTEGYGRTVVDIYGVGEGDVVLIITSVGITTMCIDEALECKDKGATVIAITATGFADNTPSDHPSRHPSNKNLHEVADYFVDCHVPMGDAVLELESVQEKFAPVSTIALAFTENLIIAKTIEILVERGVEPPIWRSANTPGGDETNQKYIDKYSSKIKHLS